MIDTSKEYIVCSAIRYGTIITEKHITVYGLTHSDCRSVLIYIFGEFFSEKSIDRKFGYGFLTSGGRFVTRKVAMRIAINCGQVQETEKIELTSEDLYK